VNINLFSLKFYFSEFFTSLKKLVLQGLQIAFVIDFNYNILPILFFFRQRMVCSRSHHNNWAKDRKNYPGGAGHPGIIYYEYKIHHSLSLFPLKLTIM